MMTLSLPNAGHPMATVISGHCVVALLMSKHVCKCVWLAMPLYAWNNISDLHKNACVDLLKCYNSGEK